MSVTSNSSIVEQPTLLCNTQSLNSPSLSPRSTVTPVSTPSTSAIQTSSSQITSPDPAHASVDGGEAAPLSLMEGQNHDRDEFTQAPEVAVAENSLAEHGRTTDDRMDVAASPSSDPLSYLTPELSQQTASADSTAHGTSTGEDLPSVSEVREIDGCIVGNSDNIPTLTAIISDVVNVTDTNSAESQQSANAATDSSSSVPVNEGVAARAAINATDGDQQSTVNVSTGDQQANAATTTTTTSRTANDDSIPLNGSEDAGLEQTHNGDELTNVVATTEREIREAQPDVPTHPISAQQNDNGARRAEDGYVNRHESNGNDNNNNDDGDSTSSSSSSSSDDDDDDDDDDGRSGWRWRASSAREDTSLPDADELKTIEASGECSATDDTHWDDVMSDLLEDPEYKVTEKESFTWKVEGYNGTRERPNKKLIMRSSVFTVGGLEWQIKFYPRGNGTDFLSIYVECLSMMAKGKDDSREDEEAQCDTKEGSGEPSECLEDPRPANHHVAPRNEILDPPIPLLDKKQITKIPSVAAVLCLILYNPAEPRTNHWKIVVHRFCPGSPDWGWTRFHGPHYRINRRREGERQALLRNDTLAIKARIHIVQDDTGCLGHSTTDYDYNCFSKIGLQSMTYRSTTGDIMRSSMVASLASWLLCKPFRQFLYGIDWPHPNVKPRVKPKPFVRFLLQIIADMRTMPDSDTKHLDLAEVTGVLRWYLEKEWDPDHGDEDVVNTWDGLRVVLEKELLGMPAAKGLSELFGARRSLITGVPSYCVSVSDISSVQEACDRSDDFLRPENPLPTFLPVELRRQRFSLASRRWEKLVNKVSINEEINIRGVGYVHYGHIVHKGTLRSGLYHAVLRPEGPGGRWYRFVSEPGFRDMTCETYSEAVTAVEGCEPSKNADETAEVAYVVMYIRKDIATKSFAIKDEPWNVPSWISNVGVIPGFEPGGYGEVDAEPEEALKSTSSTQKELNSTAQASSSPDSSSSSAPPPSSAPSQKLLSPSPTSQEEITSTEPSKTSSPPKPESPTREMDVQVIDSRIFLRHKGMGFIDAFHPDLIAENPMADVYYMKLMPNATDEEIKDKLMETIGGIKDRRQCHFWVMHSHKNYFDRPHIVAHEDAMRAGFFDVISERRLWVHITPYEDLPAVRKRGSKHKSDPEDTKEKEITQQEERQGQTETPAEPQSNLASEHETQEEVRPEMRPRTDQGVEPWMDSDRDSQADPPSNARSDRQRNEQSGEQNQQDMQLNMAPAAASATRMAEGVTVNSAAETYDDAEISTVVSGELERSQNGTVSGDRETSAALGTQEQSIPAVSSSVGTVTASSDASRASNHVNVTGEDTSSSGRNSLDQDTGNARPINNSVEQSSTNITPATSSADTIETPDTSEGSVANGIVATNVDAHASNVASASNNVDTAAGDGNDAQPGTEGEGESSLANDDSANTEDASQRNNAQQNSDSETAVTSNGGGNNEASQGNSNNENEESQERSSTACAGSEADEKGQDGNDDTYVFLKVFDYEKQTLTAWGSFVISVGSRIDEAIQKKLGLPDCERMGVWLERTDFGELDHADTFAHQVPFKPGYILIYAKKPVEDESSSLLAYQDPPMHVNRLQLENFFPEMVDGPVTLNYFGEDAYMGMMKNGFMHGQGKRITYAGTTYTGTFRFGERHGLGQLIYSNGDEYYGDWVHDQREGQGRFVQKATGNVYEGGWLKDRQHGAGVTTWKLAEEAEHMCKICWDEGADAALYDCGHVVACLKCAKQMETCPVCRKRVLSAMKLYY